MPYKYLPFRYVSLIAFGCFFAVGKVKLKRTLLVLMFVLGLGWQAVLNYIPLSPTFMNLSWARVNCLSTLFVIPIMYCLIERYKTRDFRSPILKRLGKASYDVFLVQMVFYAYGKDIIYKNVNGTLLQLLVCILVCCIVGYAFYLIESRITERVLKAIRKKQYFEEELNSLIRKINKHCVENAGE